MWREITALWSLGTLLLSPASQGNVHSLLHPAAAVAAVSSPAAPVLRTAVTSEMKAQFDECLREIAQQIKVQFADEVVSRHPIFRTPIRVSDSRVTIDKIVAKLQAKTQSYVDNGGGVQINLAWDKQHDQWALGGYLLWWKDAQTGETRRQYAKTLQELKNLVCGP